MCKKILIVDDERHILRLIQVSLSRAGYEALTAANGVDALLKARTEQPDLIICDLKMPYMHGFDLVRNLKTDSSTCQIPIIMMSSDTRPDTIQAAVALGVERYIAKPFDPIELLHCAAQCHRVL